MNTTEHIAILGGGPAGLAAGYYAKKKAMPFTIYEAGNSTGGNCRTIHHQGFLFDTGAHRLHDKDHEVTKEIQHLLGDDLIKINVPSQLYYKGKYLDFPLSPLNLVRNMGAAGTLKASADFILRKVNNTSCPGSFENYAIKTYGKTIAREFLLNYSSKLWGLDCSLLSPQVSGSRLKGLDLKTFLVETFKGSKAKVRHIDGSFYYPKKGFGQITDKLAEYCEAHNIITGARITKIFHHNNKIESVELNHEQKVQVENIINTLPLPTFVQMLHPAAPAQILKYAKQLKFRNVLLIVFFIDKKTVNSSGTIYFPTKDTIFTRIYEPRNRSVLMSPKNKTSLVIEIPCFSEDNIWLSDEGAIIEKTKNQLFETGLVNENEFIGSLVYRMKHAYPVLEKNTEGISNHLLGYLSAFHNVQTIGRNGRFAYAHLHDMMRFGKQATEHFHKEFYPANISPG